MEKEDEKQLVQQLLSGDNKALRTVYSLYRRELLSFVSGRISDKHFAEELSQDILMNFLESLRDFRHQSSLKTFLFSIARNKIIDYIRKKKVKQLFFSHMPAFMVEGLISVVMDDELERKDLQLKLEKTFDSMPHDYQLVLRLKYIDDKSVTEIAEVLKRTFKSTESLLFRARKSFIEIYTNLT
ncbi:RNA polymerase sigma factor [Candidatus Woesebacteria bacterium]|nr:RNA polymerase sigma factor [Candidatus Woesebacteria bacterium]